MALAQEVRQGEMQEKVPKLATEIPDTRAVEWVSELTGMPVNNHHNHDTLNRVAAVADQHTVIPDEGKMTRRIDRSWGWPPMGFRLYLVGEDKCIFLSPASRESLKATPSHGAR